MAHPLVEDLQLLGSPAKASHALKFFKTGKGEYGEGDLFIGVTVPEVRTVATKYKNLSLQELDILIADQIHEVRLCVLIILTNRMKKATEKTREEIYEFYIKNTKYINNWDLVDTSVRDIVGAYLFDKDIEKLIELAHSKDLWEQRMAIVATYYHIKKGHVQLTFDIADLLLFHKHDLIHKAVGWMLREAGKLDEGVLDDYLKTRYQQMPRTALRYAIERMHEPKRKSYLNGHI